MTITGLDNDFSMTWRGQDWSFQESIHVGVCSTNWQFLGKNCLNETFFVFNISDTEEISVIGLRGSNMASPIIKGV